MDTIGSGYALSKSSNKFKLTSNKEDTTSVIIQELVNYENTYCKEVRPKYYEIGTYRKEIHETSKQYAIFKHKKKIVWFTVFPVAMIIIPIVTSLKLFNNYKIQSCLISIAIVALLSLVISLIVTKIVANKVHEKIKYCNRMVDGLTEAIKIKYENSSKMLPIEYSKPIIVGKLIDIIVESRANSIDEAIDVYNKTMRHLEIDRDTEDF